MSELPAPVSRTRGAPNASSSSRNRIANETQPGAANAALSSFDPYSPGRRPVVPVETSLLDDDESTVVTVTTVPYSHGDDHTYDDDDDGMDCSTSHPLDLKKSISTPGVAGYLEIEEEPPRATPQTTSNVHIAYEEPIRTSSGLLLTHRRTPAEAARYQLPSSSTTSASHDEYQNHRNSRGINHHRVPKLFGSPSLKRPPVHNKERFEVENPWSATNASPQVSFLQQSKRILSFVRIWVLLSIAILFLGTAVVVHHARRESSAPVQPSSTVVTTADQVSNEEGTTIYLLPMEDNVPSNNVDVPDTVVLLPLPLAEESHHHHHHEQQHQHSPPRGHRMLLADLRNEFDDWIKQHGKSYRSRQEKEHRFQIWTNNRHRTEKKNQRHGPCRMTKQPVFGANRFQDLTPEEFQSEFLTGYTGPTRDKEPRRTRSLGVLQPPNVHSPRAHPDVRRRLVEQRQDNPRGTTYTCKWYDVSCILQYLFETYLYGIGGTMEPAYDADSYPIAMDWRDIGAVTSVHSQGNCGACWAITSVETIESAVFIGTGKLYDLSESEVIVCAEECEMCSGGWPQEAFEYVMSHKGLPLESDFAYNADFLLELTSALEGESEQMDEDDVNSYRSSTCPSNKGGGGGGGSHSNDNNAKQSNSYGNTFTRYGKIEGYGYATDKCVCYTDGSGCDCDKQDESLAVRNLATYGPAVVCLDASTWQDYQGGIITSESGCSSKFLDVNHCVQAVGYAFMSIDEEQGEEERGREGGSHDSKDDKKDEHGGGGGNAKGTSGRRDGYWIVRNQWSRYWGMNGYAYVAMGDNTCGILNDMIIAIA